MTSLNVVAAVLAGVWALAWLVATRVTATALRGPAATCLLLAVTSAASAVWTPIAPLTLAAWFVYALAVPNGRLDDRPRQLVAALVGLGAVGWTVALAADSAAPDTPAFVAAALALAVGGALAVVARCRRANDDQRRTVQWLAAAVALVVGSAIVFATLHVLVGSPDPLLAWLGGSLVLIPLAQIAVLVVPGRRAATFALVESIAVAGVAALVAAVYLVIVGGINGTPQGHERGVLLSSLAAAIVVAVLALPVRNRLVGMADLLIRDRTRSTEEVVTTFGARMSRAVPMDELLLQLVESLRADVAPAGAEIWTGTGGLLTRAVSMPEVGAGRMQLGERERTVIGQARIGGPGWATVWLPDVLSPASGDLRVVPIAHLGELLGLIIVRRAGDAAPFGESDERALVELARQLGLALNNVRLDSALQASLAELAERNEQLQASRRRIVTASDESRRTIERNLHDGAQQHLVALAVKLSLAGQIAADGDTEIVAKMLGDLRADVQTTIGELRELAHGIYPPLLRDRGLSGALHTAATRSVLPCTVEVDLPGRYPEEVETAAYFCCLEAMQNAGKYAGDGATVRVHVGRTADRLCFELVDDGAGFDTATTPLGHGFTNMQDRLGAIGGELEVESAPGAGTTVRATIPALPVAEIRRG